MSDPKKIYTVFGECGEYSDWRMWAVRAFESKDSADAFCAKLNAIAAEQKAKWKEFLEGADNDDFDGKQSKFTAELCAAGDAVSEFDNDNTFNVVEIDFGLPAEAVTP
jgi:hypothetical protein